MNSSTKLNVMAVAAPQWIANTGTVKQYSLNSTDPFSLQNALRLAGYFAEKKFGYWGKSNWNTKKGRKESISLFNFYEDSIEFFFDYICDKKPNVIFIGAMTLALPGAVSLAKCAKKIFRDKVFIVLGGKHCNETIFRKNNSTNNLPSSPLQLIAKAEIPNVFDLIVAGDGEDIVFNIGETIGKLLFEEKDLKSLYLENELVKNSKGDWIAGWVNEAKSINYWTSRGIPIDYNLLPTPAEVFGITDNFSIFNADITAHASSDIGMGCVFDCYFCSERFSIKGKFKQQDTAPDRLINQFKKIIDVAQKENKAKIISAFVEDSILLGGVKKNLEKLSYLIEKENVKIKFGAQFTIDIFQDEEHFKIIKKLKENGLEYVLFGIETINEDIVTKMSKNTKKMTGWVNRIEDVLNKVSSLDLKCCVCILWGIGESQQDRVKQIHYLKKWRKVYGTPDVVGLNWATLHPLHRIYPDTNYNYADWGTSKDSIYLPIFIELFGEASEKFSLPNVLLPSIEEFEELKHLFYKYSLQETPTFKRNACYL